MLSDKEIVKKLGVVGLTFFGQFYELQEIQSRAIPPILSGKNVLLASTTASGKTEAVFAPLVARLQAVARGGQNCIKLLAICPTRALVNDLYHRLENRLANINWTCGRQTSDHRDKYKKPDVLITTPESFDSMLVRDGVWEAGNLTGHLLAYICAVFIDEAHLFESSPRGDQLIWLLARLRRLRKYAFQKNWWPSEDVQICAASATVSDPQFLARKLCGDLVITVNVQGNRELEIFSADSGLKWKKIADIQSIDKIYPEILRADGKEDIESIVAHIWDAIKGGDTDQCRKGLIFVPSRSLCDKISTILAEKIGKRRSIFISGHHGSLEKPKREEAERQFARCRDALLVATTTLEVGIDIGDVDAVILIGPPSDTSSFLQRVGRAGRRIGIVKIVAIARNEIEARAFTSILDMACRGGLDSVPHGRRWSIFIQQAASHIAQSGNKGRRLGDLINLAEGIWPEPEGTSASQILENLIDEEYFDIKGDRLFLGDFFSDQLEQGRGGFHHNFESEALGLPVIDSTCGEIIAYVSDFPGREGMVALAGQKWEFSMESGEIILRASSGNREPGTFRYAARTAPCRHSFAQHVRRGVGLAPAQAPVISFQDKYIWFHFGGSAYERVLFPLFPNLRALVSGIATYGAPDEAELKGLTQNPQKVFKVVESIAEQLGHFLSPGKYHKLLPETVRTSVVIDLFDVDSFINWANSLKIIQLKQYDALGKLLVSLL